MSANACISRWRRNAPGLSSGRCNAFADVFWTFADLAIQTRNERVRSAMRTQGKQKATRKDRSLDGVGGSLGATGLSERSLSKRFAMAGNHDPLYLFARHLEWDHWRNLGGYQALVAALDDSDQRIRVIAEMLLHRSSPRPQRKGCGLYSR
jgi:hypothetical protein